MNTRRYKAVPPCVIIPGILPEFRIYIPTPQGRLILWAANGNKVAPEQLSRLSESGTKEVFINLEDESKYERHLENNLGMILDNEHASDDDKASIFTRVSTNIVKSAFETSFGEGTMDPNTINRTEKMVKSAMAFITESKSLKALVKMTGHDYQTYKHATKVLWFTVAFLRRNPDVIRQIKANDEVFGEKTECKTLEECGVGALLHDIGKALIPQEILNKEGLLNDIEYEIVKRHPLNSLAMLVDADMPLFVKEGILYHHEDFHGGGYPMGRDGENIPILARILRIIDVFDAMTSRRPYKDPIPPIKAVEIMIRKSNNGSDPEDEKRDNRDSGMKECFDENLLRKFIVFLGNATP
jgi:HD-GYP domain-containing protein (c-di-GMP phosphodiesterase class II)